MRIQLVSFAIILSAATVMVGCGGSSKSNGGVSQFVSRVTSGDGSVTAALRSGAAPSAGSGPTITASTTGLNIVGGSKIIDVSSPTAFVRVIVAVDGKDGFFELTGLPSAASGTIVVTLTQNPPSSSFGLRVAAGTGTDSGAYQTLPISLTTVGTGDVQVSVTWDVESDVDLHVLDPAGEEIYYGNTSASGGSLDLDSNPACTIDNKKNENITWPTGGAPRGTYKVLVDYFASCQVTSTKYVVTVNVKGQPAQTFSGTFDGEGDRGVQCFPAACGVPVASFTF